MYHPMAMDQIRVQQEGLRRQAEWTWTFAEAGRRRYPPKPRRQWRLRPVAGRLRLAFAAGRTARPCTDC